MIFTNYGLDQFDENVRQATGGPFDTSGGTVGSVVRAGLGITSLFESGPLPPSAAANRIALNGDWGNAFETSALRALELEKNTSLVGGAIPDAFPPGGSAIYEIKDWQYVSLTRQLRLEADYAIKQGIPLNLIVNSQTQVSGPLLERISETGGWVFRFDPQEGMLSPFIE